jgi:thiol-disulfide isomerase/thioredoxin
MGRIGPDDHQDAPPMTLSRRLCATLGLLAAAAAGCGDAITPETTPVTATPDAVIAPQAPGATAPATKEGPTPGAATPPTVADETARTAEAGTEAQPGVRPIDLAAAAPKEVFAKGETAQAEGVALRKLTYAQFKEAVANPKVKYTLVDVWATTCGPCKENFPHLVSMSRAYRDKGLACLSLTLDDREDTKAVADAEAFLKSQGATFTNVLLDEEFGAGYEQLNINAIPAVFVFGPDGKEVKRYTMDDPDAQFTYDEVERDIAALLEGKPLPAADAAKDQPKPADATK